jgi:Fe-S-cluster containining protein
MISLQELAGSIRRIGFACRGCGTCCGPSGGDAGRVLVSPPEIRALIAVSGDEWGDAVEPYPEWIDGPDESRYTLAWCLKHGEKGCRFNVGGRCRIYSARPWICRTYPFMLDGNRLLVSECPGLGGHIAEEDAYTLASMLMDRQVAEFAEEERLKPHIAQAHIPSGSRAVIDGEGVKVLHG